MKKPLAFLFAVLLAAQSASAAVISTVRIAAPVSGVSGAIGAQSFSYRAPLSGNLLGAAPLLGSPNLALGQAPVVQQHLIPVAGPAVLSPVAAPSLVQTPAPIALAAPTAPLSQLTAGVESLTEAARGDASGVQTQTALTNLFNGQTQRPVSELTVPQAPGGSGLRPGAQLQPARSDSAPKQPGADKPASEPKPRSSLARTFKVGLIGAVVPLLITNVAIAVAVALGYQLHPNYSNPGGEVAGLAAAALFGVMAAVVAPISEEVVFRKGIMGGFRKAFKKVSGEAGAFWIPAILSSLIFVAVHETADPLLFATRFVHSMIISRVFYKEGLPASMVAHGVFNGLLVLPMLLVALLGTTVGGIAALAVTPAAALLALRFWRQLKAQAPERKSGALVNVEVTRQSAFTMAASLLAAFFLLMPNPIWAAGAIGLAIYGFRRK